MSQFSIRAIFFRRSFGVERVVATTALSVALFGGAVGCQSSNKCALCGSNRNDVQKALGQLPEEDEAGAIAVPVAPNKSKNAAIIIRPTDGTGNFADADSTAIAQAEQKVASPEKSVQLVGSTVKKVDEEKPTVATSVPETTVEPSDSTSNGLSGATAEATANANANGVAAEKAETGNVAAQNNNATSTATVEKALKEGEAEILQEANAAQKTGECEVAQNLANGEVAQENKTPQNGENANLSETPQNGENAELNEETQIVPSEDAQDADDASSDEDGEDVFVRSRRGDAAFETASLNGRRRATFGETSVRSIPKTVAFKAVAEPVAVVKISENRAAVSASSTKQGGPIDASTRSFPIGDPRLESGRRGQTVSASTFGNEYITVGR